MSGNTRAHTVCQPRLGRPSHPWPSGSWPHHPHTMYTDDHDMMQYCSAVAVRTCPCRKKQQLVADLLQPEASFPRPTFLAADLASTSLDTVLLAPAPTSNSGSRFDPAQPTLFTVEGLIYYLPQDAVRGLFEAMLRVAAPGSRVAFDFLHKEVRRHTMGVAPRSAPGAMCQQ